MTSADDSERKHLRTLRITPCKVTSFTFLGVIRLGAWWVCGNLLVDFGERNCSAAKIVSRNPDDSGQVTVNQRTTTPLFKVIIRDR